MFSQLAVTCMCSLQSSESADKRDLSFNFFPDQWERIRDVRELGGKKMFLNESSYCGVPPHRANYFGHEMSVGLMVIQTSSFYFTVVIQCSFTSCEGLCATSLKSWASPNRSSQSSLHVVEASGHVTEFKNQQISAFEGCPGFVRVGL